MILYTLLCQYEHQFESWFDSSAAYDKLQKSALVECPHCGSTKIRKALMTPQLGGTRANKKTEDGGSQAKTNDHSLRNLHTEARQLARKIRNHVKENADNMGDKFAQEARKIHDQQVEPHNIYGRATLNEVTELAEDGIDFSPLPDLPEDKN